VGDCPLESGAIAANGDASGAATIRGSAGVKV
jgi:hypothetical protein